MRAQLIRDKMTARDGHDEEVRPANSRVGKMIALAAKIHEEAAEICKEPTDPVEYADLLEVMLEMMRLNDVSWDVVERALLQKRERKGAFRMGMIFISPTGVDAPREPLGYPQDDADLEIPEATEEEFKRMVPRYPRQWRRVRVFFSAGLGSRQWVHHVHSHSDAEAKAEALYLTVTDLVNTGALVRDEQVPMEQFSFEIGPPTDEVEPYEIGPEDRPPVTDR